MDIHGGYRLAFADGWPAALKVAVVAAVAVGFVNELAVVVATAAAPSRALQEVMTVAVVGDAAVEDSAAVIVAVGYNEAGLALGFGQAFHNPS